ncbi:heme/hemin ABC transporter substrate-binding protein [Aliamphritea spongicola]|uniref:heme/hemin ABC transporter substrate-binding protein n=1 Tax=Aliamphritea spongicola TaxID=707589 RepID=UPI00196A5062|nr:ABC transporter substrate-binding protein [Aliamphritea spongicola]MBN3564348.1 ABC transporter substrate-binding protein [Aliamphritea spongicola]
MIRRSLFTPLLAGLMMLAPLAQAAPERIVSADGSLTEIIYALGEEHRLVGVDTTSGYPQRARELPQIGYKRNISAEGTLSLAPEVMIATEDSGPDTTLRQITAAGVMIHQYSAAPTLATVREKIIGLATLLDKPEEGHELWAAVDASVTQAQRQLEAVDQPVRVMFVLSNANGSAIIGGENTHADTVIRLAGGVNAASGFEGYKPMPDEAIAAARPDIILMMTREGNHEVNSEILSKPGFAMTPAAAERRLVKMDGMLMLGFGPRIGEAVEGLIRAFYPDAGQLSAQHSAQTVQ